MPRGIPPAILADAALLAKRRVPESGRAAPGEPGAISKPVAESVRIENGRRCVQLTFTIIAGESLLLLPEAANRTLLIVQNVGLNAGFVSLGVEAGVGVGLYLGATSGGFVWDTIVPTNAVYAYSAAGTVYTVIAAGD